MQYNCVRIELSEPSQRVVKEHKDLGEKYEKDIYRIVRQLDYTLSDNEIEIRAENSLDTIK